MKTWLLDDGPLGVLAQVWSPDWVWPAGTLHVVDEVARAAARDKSGRRRQLLDMKRHGEPVIVSHLLMVGGAAADFMYRHLRPSGSEATKNLAEHAAIALAATELSDAVLVTMDKGAAYLGLAELGIGRVSAPFDCWEELRAGDLISSSEFEELCARVARGDGHLSGLPKRFRT